MICNPSRASRPWVACSIAFVTSGCVTSSTTLGELDYVDEIQRLVPSELDATPLTADRFEIVREDASRRETLHGQVFRLDDLLVVRPMNGAEQLIPIRDIESVEMVHSREVRNVVHAEATNYSGIVALGVVLGIATLVFVASAN